ncbi:hypothetical protein [Hyphomicrobium sp.]|uniref:hypothetical protein n=1 Tax=Hyphomicrobium sp. TaxID=82 RepID=UPI000FA50735|nr:hypothetical protein [Hyphomicrobium sp.]RUP00187.1 MAG: hypothetical protein EKK30_03500 [Hyphomicrobium sp.]
MLGFVRTLARIVFGWAVASLAAGLVTVLFVDIDVLAGPLDRLPKTLSETFDLALLAATHIAIFASVFVLITAVISEWFSIRTLAFYLLVGIAIAFLGFSVQYASEVAGQPTILNNYAVKAFMTVGFAGGFVYWLSAGQFAGRAPQPENHLLAASASGTARENDEESSEVVITRPPNPDERPRWRMPALERLRFANRTSRADPDAADGDDPSTRAD